MQKNVYIHKVAIHMYLTEKTRIIGAMNQCLIMQISQTSTYPKNISPHFYQGINKLGLLD